MSTAMGPLPGTDKLVKKAAPRVLPLRLAPIDDFFLIDDRPEYPMTFTSHLCLAGEVDREAFAGALDEALLRHPILGALVKPIKANQPCWTRVDGIRPVVRWGRLGDDWQLPKNSESFDLNREVGLRIWVHVGEGRSEILFQFHHACCDGTGAYRFIGDLLAEYGILTAVGEEVRPEHETCDPQLLRTRRMKMASAEVLGTLPQLIYRGLGHARRIFARRITPLAPGAPTYRHQDPVSPPFPGIATITFSRDEHRELRAAASAAGGMLNDLLLTEMFVAMHEWNRAHGGRRRERMRIMMPTDLREKDDILMPAANMTSYSFLTRISADCQNAKQLLKSVRDETALIKHEKRGKHFIDAVMVASAIPGLLRFLLRRKRCLATVILSNVGDPTRRFLARFPREAGRVIAGNVRLDAISGVPPLRHYSRATVSIVTYGRDLAINMRCDPTTMSEVDTQNFLELYGLRLRRHLAQYGA